MGFKENLKKYRLEKSMTLEELANVIGVSRQTVQKYESGVISNIPFDKIEKLSKALDISPSILMGWNNKKEKSLYYLLNDTVLENDFMKNTRAEILKELFKNEDFEKNVKDLLSLIKCDLLLNKNNLSFNDRIEIFNQLKKYYEFLLNDYINKTKK